MDEEVANYFSRYQPVFSVRSLFWLTAIHRGRFRRDNIIHSGRRADQLAIIEHTFKIGLEWQAIEQNKFIMGIFPMLLDVDFSFFSFVFWPSLAIDIKNAQLLRI